MSEEQKQALAYLAQVASDYIATLSLSVRGPVTRECQAAVKTLEEEKDSHV